MPKIITYVCSNCWYYEACPGDKSCPMLDADDHAHGFCSYYPPTRTMTLPPPGGAPTIAVTNDSRPIVGAKRHACFGFKAL